MPGFCFVDIRAALKSAAFLFLLSACGGNLALRQETLALARQGGFQVQKIAPQQFSLLVLSRIRESQPSVLSVYIEGDGAPWPSPHHPPRDPTPTSPLMLTMAMADPAPNTVYLGRPCQYLDSLALANCDPTYRDEARFAPNVVAEYDHILDDLKQKTGAKKLHLTGYSGGGVIAALLAARRTDVKQWTTIAAPLDLSAWTRHHGISPLTDSLDPAGLPVDALPPGRHLAGANDPVVPPLIIQGFTASHGGRLRIVPNFDHVCCWAEQWPRLLKETSE